MANQLFQSKTDEEQQRLESIAETNCADILRQVISHKAGGPQCSLFCQEIAEKCTSFTLNQRALVCSGSVSDFDAALCMKVARQIKGINPKGERWNSEVADNDHSLFGSLRRINLFRKEVLYCPENGKMSFQELSNLILTAFQDIQSKMPFERDFHAEVNATLNGVITPTVYSRLSSMVTTDATAESGGGNEIGYSRLSSMVITDNTAEPGGGNEIVYSRLSSMVKTDATAEPGGENDTDLELEYSFLYRFSSEERDIAKDRIRLIMKYKHRFPAELKAPQSDIMVVYSEDDHNEAERFCQTFNGRDLTLEDGTNAKVKAVLYDDERFRKSQWKTVDTAYERSTYAFLYLTKSFVESDYQSLVAEALLIDSINNKEKQWRVVPFHSSPSGKYKVPFGINTLKSMDAFNPNEYYWKQIDRLLCAKIHEREEREREMFDKEYNEALKIQEEDNGKQLADRFKELSFHHTKPSPDRPVSTVQPLVMPDDSTPVSHHGTDKDG